jgi:hypothetical protein
MSDLHPAAAALLLAQRTVRSARTRLKSAMETERQARITRDAALADYLLGHPEDTNAAIGKAFQLCEGAVRHRRGPRPRP